MKLISEIKINKGIYSLCIPLLFVLFQLACNEPSKRNEDFEFLKSETLSIDSKTLKNPIEIFIVDSFLIISDSYDDNLISIYDLKSNKLIKRVLNTEKYNSIFHIKQRNNKFTFLDTKDNTIYLFNFNNLYQNNNNFSAISINKLLQNQSIFLYSPILLSNGSIISNGNFNFGKFIFIKNGFPKYYFKYPIDSQSNHIYDSDRIKSSIYQGQIKVKPDNSKFVYFSMLNHFEIIAIDTINHILDNIYTRIPANLPKYSIYIDGQSGTLQRNTPFYFGYAITTDKYIFVLNKEGKSYLEDGFNKDYSNLLEIYDWNGNLLNSYRLDKQILSMALSSSGKYLYAVSKNEETFVPQIISFKIHGVFDL